TDFQMDAGAPAGELQMLQYTMATWAGFSGSPILLPSGRVAAIHNMARTIKNQNGETRSIAHGVRIDCLLELLVHPGLTAKVPFAVDKSKVGLDKGLKPAPRGEKARADFAKACELVEEAYYQTYVLRAHDKAVAMCEEALNLAPSYAKAYNRRGIALTNFY